MSELSSWEFDEGDEIVPGRHALQSLGGGYRYEAYLAWDEQLLALAVVKILRPDRVEEPRALRGLRAEARAINALSHPVLLRCFDTVLDGDRPHLLLEYLEGPRLSTLLRRHGPLPVEQLIPLTMQLCSGLHYMSTKQMVHLDVKPKNIIMAAPPRLIDLSVARSFEEAAKIDSLIGTDAYMAPEQCSPGSAPIGSPADVWGLGVTLYEAATGRLPFPKPPRSDDGEAEARFTQLDHEPSPIPESVPPAIRETIMSCLRRDPAARPTASDVAGATEKLQEALPRRPVLGRLRPRIR